MTSSNSAFVTSSPFTLAITGEAGASFFSLSFAAAIGITSSAASAAAVRFQDPGDQVSLFILKPPCGDPRSDSMRQPASVRGKIGRAILMQPSPEIDPDDGRRA